MIRNDENLEVSTLSFLIHPQAEARGQVQLCKNLMANLFEKGDSPCTNDFPDVKINRQFHDHYLKGICNLTSQYRIYTKETISPNAFHDKYLIQTDDVDIEFSKVFTEYIKSIQHQNSQKANSKFIYLKLFIYIRIKRTSKRFNNSNILTYNHTTRNKFIFKIFKCNP